MDRKGNAVLGVIFGNPQEKDTWSDKSTYLGRGGGGTRVGCGVGGGAWAQILLSYVDTGTFLIRGDEGRFEGRCKHWKGHWNSYGITQAVKIFIMYGSALTSASRGAPAI